MSWGVMASASAKVAAPKIAELEPSPNSETQEAASPISVTRPETRRVGAPGWRCRSRSSAARIGGKQLLGRAIPLPVDPLISPRAATAVAGVD